MKNNTLKKSFKPVLLYLSIILFSNIACKKDKEKIEVDNDITLSRSSSYEDAVNAVPGDLLLKFVNTPDENGALTRNKEGYFSVRFQMDMASLTDVAVTQQRKDALEEYIKALDYSFKHQLSNGGYKLIVPDDLSELNPTDADSVSAVAFFAYSLTTSLHSLNNSDWYINNSSLAEIKEYINSKESNIQKTVDYLLANENLLYKADSLAPNRLLFNAIAMYGLGLHLNNENAMNSGITFMETALTLIDSDEGYFIEEGGWDSSYNGVAIKLAMELFMLLTDTEAQNKLEPVLVKATQWQESRILETGEISVEGNTRVFHGGESFVGKEKEVDIEKTIRAFYYFSVLAEDDSFKNLADKIVDYYKSIM